MACAIVFETHATSVDNEAGIASGHHDAELSQLGVGQASQLGSRHAAQDITAVWCSDLRRSYRTAEIAFGERGIQIFRDCRLRECDYGDFTRSPEQLVNAEKPARISTPFPNGESYLDVTARVNVVLTEIAARFPTGHVVMIGHRATWYALEYLLKGIALDHVVVTAWNWQPGWVYALDRPSVSVCRTNGSADGGDGVKAVQEEAAPTVRASRRWT